MTVVERILEQGNAQVRAIEGLETIQATGAVERPTHRNTSWDEEKFEVAAQRWADLSETGYGVSLLNDCKYGYDIRDNVMRITLLRGTTTPDPNADEGPHAFTYALLPHAGNWTEADTVRRACAGADVTNMPFMDVRDFKDPDYFQTLRKKLLAFEQEAPDAYYTLLRHIEVDLTWAKAKKSRKRRKKKQKADDR